MRYLFIFLIAASLCANEEMCDFCDYDACELVYFKIGGGIPTRSDSRSSLAPMVGIGKRCQFGAHAIDISASLCSGSKSATYYSLPRLAFLAYLWPESTKSPYFGGGLSWAGVSWNEKKRKKMPSETEGEVSDESYDIMSVRYHKKSRYFHGIFGDLVVGFEWLRFAPFRPFMEVSVAQGLIPFAQKGGRPKLSLFFNFGAMF